MSKALAFLLIVVLGGVARAEETAAEPTPEALAAAWLEQRFGGDAVEIWTTSWDAQALQYGVARRWSGGRPEVLLRVQKPRQWDELAFLMRARAGSSPEILYYRTAQIFPVGTKAARPMPVAKPDLVERLPFVPGLPLIGTVWPSSVDLFTFTRLPDQEISGEPCRVIEARLRQPEETFDRFVAALSRKSGVALETKWFHEGKLVRRVTSAPGDVKDFGDRRLPARIVVAIPGDEDQEFRLRKLMLDVALPDQLFATSNLKTGRFPSY